MLSRRNMIVAGAAVLAGPARAAPSANPFHEFTLGNPKARVTVIEYASLTCPHCAHFATATFPEVKKAYIDTGKIRFLLRDFPLDGLATAGTLVARCAPPDQGLKLVEALFANQEAWVSAPKPIDPLRAQAKAAGMSEADFDACLQNRTLLTALREEQQRASDQYKIEATPSFFIGDEDLQGDPPYADIAAAIDRQLAKARHK